MSILAECPGCHRKQTIKNKKCPSCHENLDQAKKSRRVRYWIFYRMPDKTQHTEAVGTFEGLDPYSIDDARTANSKREIQKKEKRLLDIKKECTMTFQELTDWYLDLDKIKGLRYFPSLKIYLEQFNEIMGSLVIGEVKPHHIESYEEKKKGQGKALHTIDLQVGAVKSMINKAFDNDKVDGDVLRVFKKIPKLMKRNGNARKRILSPDEFKALNQALPLHSKWILGIGFFSGMRKKEILSLTWDKVTMADREIRLEAKDTKDKEPRTIPICNELYEIFKSIPRAVHDNHVILYHGKPIKDFSTSLKAACERAKIIYGKNVKGGFISHDLRHSFNTYMRKAGVQESVIMEITGHSTREMFDRYNSIDGQDKKEAIQRFEVFLTKAYQNAYQGGVAENG